MLTCKVMALPLWMLRNLQIQRSRKISLTAMFLIVTVIIVVDLVRAVDTTSGPATSPLELLWTVIEPAIAVIISALPTYKALLGRARRNRTTPSEIMKGYSETRENIGSLKDDHKEIEIERRVTLEQVTKDVSPEEYAVSSRDTILTTNIV